MLFHVMAKIQRMKTTARKWGSSPGLSFLIQVILHAGARQSIGYHIIKSKSRLQESFWISMPQHWSCPCPTPAMVHYFGLQRKESQVNVLRRDYTPTCMACSNCWGAQTQSILEISVQPVKIMFTSSMRKWKREHCGSFAVACKVSYARLTE